MIAACAPKRYQRIPAFFIAADRSRRRSATAFCDTTEVLRDAKVNSEVVESIAGRRPVGIERADVLPKFVTDAQGIRRSHLRSLFRPSAPFRFRNRVPVAARKGDQVFVSHRGRIAKW